MPYRHIQANYYILTHAVGLQTFCCSLRTFSELFYIAYNAKENSHVNKKNKENITLGDGGELILNAMSKWNVSDFIFKVWNCAWSYNYILFLAFKDIIERDVMCFLKEHKHRRQCYREDPDQQSILRMTAKVYRSRCHHSGKVWKERKNGSYQYNFNFCHTIFKNYKDKATWHLTLSLWLHWMF